MNDSFHCFNHHPEHDGFSIDCPVPEGMQWFEVKNPFEHLFAPDHGQKRDMKTAAQKKALRRQARQKAQTSPYLQVALQFDRTYQKKMNAILKG